MKPGKKMDIQKNTLKAVLCFHFVHFFSFKRVFREIIRRTRGFDAMVGEPLITEIFSTISLYIFFSFYFMLVPFDSAFFPFNRTPIPSFRSAKSIVFPLYSGLITVFLSMRENLSWKQSQASPNIDHLKYIQGKQLEFEIQTFGESNEIWIRVN